VPTFLRQSNCPLFAPYVRKVGTWTICHFCGNHKKTKVIKRTVTRSIAPTSRDLKEKAEAIVPRLPRIIIFWFCATFLPFYTLSSCESRSKLQRKRCSPCFSQDAAKFYKVKMHGYADLAKFLVDGKSFATKRKKFSLSSKTLRSTKQKKAERSKPKECCLSVALFCQSSNVCSNCFDGLFA
jgi:hypothetical protein